MELKQLIERKNLIFKMYSGITDFNRVLKIAEKTLEPIDRALKIYEEKRKTLIEKAKTEPQQADNEHLELLGQNVDIHIEKVTEGEIRKVGFNPLEYMAIKDYVKGKNKK